MTLSKGIRPQEEVGSYITKWLPGHKVLNWPKNSQNRPKNSTFRSDGGGSDSCYIGNQPLYFH